MTIELLQVILPALVAGLMIALTHAPLGLEVLKRGIIFIDLAIAQIAGLGLLVAIELFHLEQGIVQQCIALLFALLAAVGFRYCERFGKQRLEAIIGSSYVLAASLAVLLVSHNPYGAETLSHLLSGQILFVNWEDVLSHAPVYLCIITLWFVKPSLREGLSFYVLFSIAITSSVQLVGVYVVFASLILPALAVSTLRNSVALAWLVGVVSVVAGSLIAVLSDLPAGPMLVVCYVLVAIVFAGCSKKLPAS